MKRRFEERAVLRESEHAIKYANRLRDTLVNLIEESVDSPVMRRYSRKRDRAAFVETLAYAD